MEEPSNTWVSPNGVEHLVDDDGRCATCGRSHQTPCFACGHVHLAGSPGSCYTTKCDPSCPMEWHEPASTG